MHQAVCLFVFSFVTQITAPPAVHPCLASCNGPATPSPVLPGSRECLQ